MRLSFLYVACKRRASWLNVDSRAITDDVDENEVRLKGEGGDEDGGEAGPKDEVD